jgi:hypothetical protein
MYVSVVLSTIIILLNTDLSCLTPYLKAINVVKTRELNTVYEKQKYAVVLPNQAVLTVRDVIFKNMATYLQSDITVDSNSITDKTLSVSYDTSCRGSPLTRAP